MKKNRTRQKKSQKRIISKVLPFIKLIWKKLSEVGEKQVITASHVRQCL